MPESQNLFFYLALIVKILARLDMVGIASDSVYCINEYTVKSSILWAEVMIVVLVCVDMTSVVPVHALYEWIYSLDVSIH